MSIDTNVEVNWIGGTSKSYPVGTNLDLAHGAADVCTLQFMTRAGLACIRCRTCGAEALVNTMGRGSVKLACVIRTTDPMAVVTPLSSQEGKS